MLAFHGLICAALILAPETSAQAPTPERSEPIEFSAMTWNIWKGGRVDGDDAGPQKVIDIIRESHTDVVAMQETYGSGERIAKELGFHFHPRGTNVSIFSRYPIVEDLSVFEEFKCVGALIELPGGHRVAFFSIWLPYDAEIWEVGTRDLSDPVSMLAACASSARDLKAIHQAIQERLADPKYANLPIVIAGDFNSMSHLDYTAIARDQYHVEIDWPTSQVLITAGYRDSWRELHPSIDRTADRTWTPRFPEQEQDRIDFVYYKGETLHAIESSRVDQHDSGFPSDHAAVVSRFRIVDSAVKEAESQCRLVSYNIRHGEGADHRLDLKRTAEVLKNLDADFIGLQEVDMNVRRTQGVNQADELGKALGMHAAFGAFMELQGGRYGMAILSRHPWVDVWTIDLPEGNEPRVALAGKALLPNGQTLTVVNVHFDWVDDDRFRYAQAAKLAEQLKELEGPWVLLGDFNDERGSRTLELFGEIAHEAQKPEEARMTFPSDQPVEEIDFVFVAPQSLWTLGEVRVVDEPIASDHRPVVVETRLKSDRH
jgi:endonuclease/exonuclease/phosphatase family metal-dependent hydrolase